MGRGTLFTLALASLVSCTGEPGPAVDEILGTWGGNDAGLIAADSTAHVHIGCTEGDAPLPIAVENDGHFSVSGRYNFRAYPVNLGEYHPAVFSGRVSGRAMTLTVTLTDTTLAFGPVTLTLGVEPQMGPCPICRKPGAPLR